MLHFIHLGVLAFFFFSVHAVGIFEGVGWRPYFYGFQNYTEQQCQAPYDTLNATGTLLVDPASTDGDMNGVSWTAAVSQPYNDGVGVTNFSLYLGTPSGFDFRPGDLNFSACAFIFLGLSDNLNRRGQDDAGGCDQTFSQYCVNAIIHQAALTAHYLTSNPTNNSPAPGNLTAGSLPRVCANIQNALQTRGAVPQECAQFVGPSMSWNDGGYSRITIDTFEITGPNSTTDENCSFNTTTLPANAASFPITNSNLSLIYELSSLSGANNRTEVYNNATTSVLPLLMVAFPPANDSRTEYSSGSFAYMNCIRANNSLPGSRVAPPLPAPTALRKLPIKLSGGTIAGIVIGSVAGVAVIAGLLAWFRAQRHRRWLAQQEKAEAARKESELEKAKQEEEVKKELLRPMADSSARYEVDEQGSPREMDTGLLNELEGSRIPELEAPRR